MNQDRLGRYAALLAVIGGVLVAGVTALVVVLLQSDGEAGITTAAVATSAATTTAVPTTEAPSSTEPNPTAPASTTTASPTTSTSTTTTTTTTSTTTTITTTLPPSVGDTLPKQGGIVGTPGGQLADVRAVQRDEGYTRIVFDFTGTGIPSYRVEYTPGPFTNIAGDDIGVSGTHYLLVTVFPAMRWDITDPNNQFPVYTGPERIGLQTRSVTEVVFVEDFEANLEWVIGVTAEKDFMVGTLVNPPRIYLDIAD